MTKQMEETGEWLDWLAAALERRRVQAPLLEVPRTVARPEGKGSQEAEGEAPPEGPLELEPCVTEMVQLRLW